MSTEYVIMKVPQIKFIVRRREHSVVPQRRVSTVQALQNSSNSTGQFLERLTRPLFYDRCMVQSVLKLGEVPQ